MSAFFTSLPAFQPNAGRLFFGRIFLVCETRTCPLVYSLFSAKTYPFYRGVYCPYNLPPKNAEPLAVVPF